MRIIRRQAELFEVPQHAAGEVLLVRIGQADGAASRSGAFRDAESVIKVEAEEHSRTSRHGAYGSRGPPEQRDDGFLVDFVLPRGDRLRRRVEGQYHHVRDCRPHSYSPASALQVLRRREDLRDVTLPAPTLMEPDLYA